MGMPVAKKCEFCTIDLYFETIESYNNHITVAHRKSTSDYIGDAYECDVCGAKYFDDCDAVNAHKAAEHQ
jgi:hypothetical protein